MRRKAGAFAVLLTFILLAAAAPAAAQLQWSSKDGSQSFKVGILGQAQAEELDVAGTNDTSKNLFLRRLRLILGYNLSSISMRITRSNCVR